jgi:hypothetical protein
MRWQCHGSAFSRRAAPEACFDFRPLDIERAQGKPGADCTHGSRATKSTGQDHRFNRIIRLSLHDGFTVSFVLSSVTGLSCHRRPKKLASQELDASVGASGPHDFAVRKISALVSSAARVHRIPTLRS